MHTPPHANPRMNHPHSALCATVPSPPGQPPQSLPPAPGATAATRARGGPRPPPPPCTHTRMHTKHRHIPCLSLSPKVPGLLFFFCSLTFFSRRPPSSVPSGSAHPKSTTSKAAPPPPAAAPPSPSSAEPSSRFCFFTICVPARTPPLGGCSPGSRARAQGQPYLMCLFGGGQWPSQVQRREFGLLHTRAASLLRSRLGVRDCRGATRALTRPPHHQQDCAQRALFSRAGSLGLAPPPREELRRPEPVPPSIHGPLITQPSAMLIPRRPRRRTSRSPPPMRVRTRCLLGARSRSGDRPLAHTCMLLADMRQPQLVAHTATTMHCSGRTCACPNRSAATHRPCHGLPEGGKGAARLQGFQATPALWRRDTGRCPSASSCYRSVCATRHDGRQR